ncbi:MAG: ATP-dependent DNA ligase [Acidilobus sp.]
MNADMPFEEVANAFSSMEGVTSRIQLTQLLAGLLKRTPADVIDKVVYMIQGKLGPDWKGIPELGVGDKLLVQSMAMAYGKSESDVQRLVDKLGDPGKVAEQLAQTGGHIKSSLLAFMGGASEQLTVSRVFDSFMKIAYATGESSRDLKLKTLAGLLKDAKPIEARYIVRFVEGRLRLGIGDATILDALSVAYGGTTAVRDVVERAYNLRADLGEIARIVAQQGVEALKGLKPEVGTPIRPMLAERASDAKEILAKVGGRAYVEYKYDGERGQIHKDGDKVKIFSRRMEDITSMYPDVVEGVKDAIKAERAIIEGEIVAIDPDTGELRPFQELMQRRRKYDIDKMMKEIPTRLFLFDIMMKDDEDLTTKPLPYRRKALESIVQPNERVVMSNYIESSDPDEIMNFFLQAISDGAEGVMIKAIHDESTYRAGVRGWLWVKLKRDYRSEMTDTVDLVVVGAFYGKGKRGGKLGTLLLAAYDPDNDVFKTVCKVGTGFTDADINGMYDMFKPYVIDHRHPRVISSIEADVWLEPVKVAEVIGAELTLSPAHTCCMDTVRKGAGISIRFPRFIRWRDDKGPEDATTEQELLEMYKRQLKKVEEKSTESEA